MKRKYILITLIILIFVIMCACGNESYDKAEKEGSQLVQDYKDKVISKINSQYGSGCEINKLEPYIYDQGGVSSLSGQDVYCTQYIETTVEVNNTSIGLVYDTEKDMLYSNQLQNTVIEYISKPILEHSDANIIKSSCSFNRSGSYKYGRFYKNGYLPAEEQYSITDLANVPELVADESNTTRINIVIIYIVDKNFVKMDYSDVLKKYIDSIYTYNKNNIITAFIVPESSEDTREICNVAYGDWALYLDGLISAKKSNNNVSTADKHYIINAKMKDIIVYCNKDSGKNKYNKYVFK